MVVVVSIAFATSVSDEVEVVDVGKATASSHAQCSGEFHLSMDYIICFSAVFFGLFKLKVKLNQILVTFTVFAR